ncbi:MAG: PTS sugar transporter subunit IIA [Mariprofundaceae bacterium]|nr:PTS sugar transporter subunit IIA [Mariprofundaceae bacterium]
MIGIVLIAHARIASEMLAAAEHVLGKQSLIMSLNVEDSDRPDQLHEQLQQMLQQTNTGDGVLIFADMFGGTPCNVALSLVSEGNVEMISGFNLPSLIKAISLRRQPVSLHELAREVASSGQQYICLASDYMVEHYDRGCRPTEDDQPDA